MTFSDLPPIGLWQYYTKMCCSIVIDCKFIVPLKLIYPRVTIQNAKFSMTPPVNQHINENAALSITIKHMILYLIKKCNTPLKGS
jgi:hypothetical protein